MRLASDHWLADRNSACPAVTVPSKKHQMLLTSPLALLSPCPPRGTRRHSQICLPCCHRAIQEAPDATRKSGSSVTVQLLYATSWYCHQCCSYYMPQAGTATNVAATVCHKLVLPSMSQLLYATSWYCYQQCSYCTPQAGTATN